MKKFFASIITFIRTIDQKLTRAILKATRIQNIITSMEASIHDLNDYIDELADVKDHEIEQLKAELEHQKLIAAAQDELIATMKHSSELDDQRIDQLTERIRFNDQIFEAQEEAIKTLNEMVDSSIAHENWLWSVIEEKNAEIDHLRNDIDELTITFIHREDAIKQKDDVIRSAIRALNTLIDEPDDTDLF